MSDVFSLFETEAADPQAFAKVSEEKTTNLSSLIRGFKIISVSFKESELIRVLKEL